MKYQRNCLIIRVINFRMRLFFCNYLYNFVYVIIILKIRLKYFYNNFFVIIYNGIEFLKQKSSHFN